GTVETGRENGARRLQDLVGPTQLRILRPQPLELVPLGRGQLIDPLTTVGLILTHPVAQRLRMHSKVPGDVGQRPVRLPRQPNRSIPQLLRVLPRGSHSRHSLPPGRSSWHQGLHPTRGGSPRPRPATAATSPGTPRPAAPPPQRPAVAPARRRRPRCRARTAP